MIQYWKKKKKKNHTKNNTKNRRVTKNYDIHLKNWKYTIPTFSDLELEIITKFQEMEIEKYPEWFVAENREFLQNTAGSGFFLDNQLAVKDMLAKQMARDFRGQYPVCCAVCAHTCWKYKSYKVLCHELPPICTRVLVYKEDDLSECTRKFYDLTEKVLNKQCNKGYKNIFLHPES